MRVGYPTRLPMRRAVGSEKSLKANEPSMRKTQQHVPGPRSRNLRMKRLEIR